MRRYPAVTEDGPFQFAVRQNQPLVSSTPRTMCAPVGAGESFSRQMAEIEYWVKTHRAPCTYVMPPPDPTPVAQKSAPTVKPFEAKDTTGIKRPADPDVLPKKGSRKRLLTLLDDKDSDRPQQSKYFFSSPTTPAKIGRPNGASTPKVVSASKKSLEAIIKNGNGDVSSESTKKSRSRATSTPIAARARNLNAGKRSSSVAVKSSPNKTRVCKETAILKLKESAIIDITESPETSAGPSKRDPADDSDTSVLTAPYIRSTRNSASRSKCQKLTRQRASRANKSRSRVKSDALDNSNIFDISIDTKESDAADNSKVKSDSSLDLFGVDTSKESGGERRSARRKLPTLHFSGTSSVPLARRSEPMVTRRQALLSASVGPAAMGPTLLSASAGPATLNGSAPGDQVPSKRKFFA